MAKITLTDISNPNSQTAISATVNANNDAIEIAMENTLSLDGTSPNSMAANLDMDSNRILNLPEPVDNTEPVRLGDLEDLLGDQANLNLDDLLDVTLTSPADNDFLRYDSGTSKWINEASAGSGGAPDTADYLVKTSNGSLSAERVVTDNTSITWDWSSAGVAKASRAALTGDVTASANSNATTIANDAVTYAKMQNVSATDRLLGRDTAAAGNVEELTVSGGLEFTGSGGIQRSALTGDVTASAGSGACTIPAGTVTLAKMANVATSRILGRTTAGTGVPEALTGAQAGGLIAIDNLSDVTITSAASGDHLAYDGAAWVNEAQRAFTATNTITWDTSTPGQRKANVVLIPVSIRLDVGDETTACTTGTAKKTFRMPHAMTVTAVRGSLTTAQAADGGGGIFTVDVNEGGVSILSTKLTIDNNEKTSTTAVTAPVISDSSLADDAEITIDIDQVGDGSAAGLKVTLIGTRVVSL